MCEFKLEELEVFNFRKFENERYKLNPQMNVFAGKNGSGKTAVLEAACVMLGAYLAAFKTYVPSRFVRNIHPEDSHLKVLSAEKQNVLTAGGAHQYPCYLFPSLDRWKERPGKMESIIERKGIIAVLIIKEEQSLHLNISRDYEMLQMRNRMEKIFRHIMQF